MSQFEALPSQVRGDECEDTRLDAFEQQLLRAVRSIRYGSVEVTIHNGRPVQIERKEKVRLDVCP